MNFKLTDQRLRNSAYFLLAYTILVILWGAWVRISHSGDGCGDTWPLCQGQVLPEIGQVAGKTWVEYFHRFMSGFYGVVVLFLFLWIRRAKESELKSSAYRWIFWVLVFMITEALLGAKLVLFGLVNTNQSIWRILVMSLHQLNSFLLVGFTVRFLAATFEQEYSSTYKSWQAPEDHKPKSNLYARPIFLCWFLVIAVTGAWASLSTTLFPSSSLFDGLTRDLDSGSHLVLKIRILHPLLGLSVGSFLSFGLYKLSLRVNSFLSRVAIVGSSLIALGVVIGFLTLILLSPIPLKLTHLLLAHMLWSTAVFFYHFYSIPERA